MTSLTFLSPSPVPFTNARLLFVRWRVLTYGDNDFDSYARLSTVAYHSTIVWLSIGGTPCTRQKEKAWRKDRISRDTMADKYTPLHKYMCSG